MKKNHSQIMLVQPVITVTPPSRLSREKAKLGQSPIKKAFQRKPAQGHLGGFSRKKVDQTLSEVDTTMEQTNSSEIIDKSKTVRFVSCRSQNSLTNSILSRSNSTNSLANFGTDSIDESQEFSRILPNESTIYESPQKEPKSRELFRRKTANCIRTPTIQKRRSDENCGSASIITNRFGRQMDHAQRETKLDSNKISQQKQNYNIPSGIMENIFQSLKQSSSKQSMRKESPSNSMHKKTPIITCQECECHRQQVKETVTKNQRLQRMLKNKEDEISNLNKRIQEIEKRNCEMERKLKEWEKSEMKEKVKHLEQQLTDCQDQCLILNNAYSQKLQQLKYKTVENTSMKKYQTQCQQIQRKMQFVIAQRNELRQRLSNLNTTSKSSYMNYPQNLSRQVRSITLSNVQNLVVPRNPFKKGESKRETYTSRNSEEQVEFDEEVEESYGQAKNQGFKKKQVTKSYEQSSQSELISLSEESNM